MSAMATDREKRIQTARGLRTELERYGAISFRGQSGTGPSPSLAAPSRAVAPARSLATSGAAVSLRPLTPAPAKNSQTVPIAAGFGILAAAAIGALVFTHSRTTPTAEEPAPVSAAANGVVEAPATTGAGVTPAPPAVVSARASAVAVPSASSSGHAKAPPFPKTIPVVAPTLATPAPPPVVAPPNPAPAPAPASEHKARRTEEKGLAKDNPFR